MTVELPRQGSLTDDIVRNAAERPDHRAFSRRAGSGWRDVTAQEFLDDVVAVARGLVATGVKEGERVGVLCKTRYEWTLLDYAIWYVGAVTVPIYPTVSTEQLTWIVNDSGLTTMFAETHEDLEKVDHSTSGQLHSTWCLEAGGLDRLVTGGSTVPADEVTQRRDTVGPEAVATLIYTSGTTGEPKGCALTHGNLMFEVSAALDQLGELFRQEDACTLLFLPLAHVFARVIQIGAVRAGVRLGYSPDAHRLPADLTSFQPTFVLAVPRVFERLFNMASQQAAVDGRAALFNRATSTAIAYSKAIDHRGPGPVLRARHRVFERVAFRDLRGMLGGRCRYAVSGGAPLGERMGHFYRGIGITVLEGYGLTETSGALTVNRPGEVRIGTVGQPLPGATIAVADDGELLAQGPQITAGYWSGPVSEALEPAIDSRGWLHTGDLGEIDDEGFVRVTGRKKEIIVTAGGKHVAPDPLEELLRAHPLVSQCMVVGDGEPFLGALITLDADGVRSFQRSQPDSTKTPPHKDPGIRAEIEAAVERANASVSPAEAIRRFALLPVEWTEESGHLTPSLKLRRREVLRDFRADVEVLFDR